MAYTPDPVKDTDNVRNMMTKINDLMAPLKDIIDAVEDIDIDGGTFSDTGTYAEVDGGAW